MKNFAWIATWKITRRCNLYCVYCDHASMLPATHAECIDYNKVIKNIGAYSPKILNISGGEPTLVEELPKILAQIKKQWNPYIRVVHNGTNPEKLIPCLPYLDRIVISLDGPDPVNKANRGICAEIVFKKLKEVLPEILNRNIEVFFNCVLTTSNLKYMRQLAQEAKNLSPAITVSYTPIMPPDCALSILNDKSLFNEFLQTFNGLIQSGFSVMHTFDTIRQHSDFKHINCYNQYFNIRVTPDGNVLTCAMNTPLSPQHYKYYFRKLFAKNSIIKAMDRIKKKAKQTLSNNVDFSCSTICSCESWLDLIFMGIESNCIPFYAKGLAGRMSEADYKSMQSFVSQYINPDFDVDCFKKIIDVIEKR
jgi:MoaA/NifB/PqqE/SkfB family radical SAM enzyme